MIIIIIKFKLITIATVKSYGLQRTTACSATLVPRVNSLFLVWGALLKVGLWISFSLLTGTEVVIFNSCFPTMFIFTFIHSMLLEEAVVSIFLRWHPRSREMSWLNQEEMKILLQELICNLSSNFLSFFPSSSSPTVSPSTMLSFRHFPLPPSLPSLWSIKSINGY